MDKPLSEAERARRAATSERMKARHEAKRQEKAAKVEAKPVAQPAATDTVTSDAVADRIDETSPGLAHPEAAPLQQADPRDESRQGIGRSERKPLGVPQQRLAAEVPEGMTGRWMNDVPGRLARALEAGYQFISSDGEAVQNRDGCRSEIVGTGRDGGAMRAYLMAIPTVLYEQDQRAKAVLNEERMTAIRRGEPSQVADQDRSAFYTPSEGISIRENTTSER